MAKTTGSLYIDNSSLRLLVTRGDRPKTWGKARLKAGLIDGLVITDPNKVADSITKLMKDHKVKQRKLMVGISAEQALTRQLVLPVLPKAMLSEAVMREAKRLLPLSLEELYISWQTIRVHEEKVYVFLIGLRRKSVDSIFKTLKAARIKSTGLTIKPLTLAQIVKDPNAIMIDAQQSDFDIIIQMNGVPRLIRTVAFSSTTPTWKEKMPFIIDEVDRTLKFYASSHPDKPMPADLPMYVSGDIAGQSELCLELNTRFGYYCSQLIATTTPTAGFSAQTYLANIAMNNLQALGKWNIELTVTSLNLLPDEYRVKPVKWGRALSLPAGLAVLAIVIPLVMASTSSSANLKSASNQLNVTTKVLETKQAQQLKLKKDVKTLQDKLVQTLATHDGASNLLKILKQASETTNADLATIINNLNIPLTFTDISLADDAFTVTGVGQNEASILSYARALSQSGRFKQVIVSTINLQVENKMNFTLVLHR